LKLALLIVTVALGEIVFGQPQQQSTAVDDLVWKKLDARGRGD
jgi:hypothetical protein